MAAAKSRLPLSVSYGASERRALIQTQSLSLEKTSKDSAAGQMRTVGTVKKGTVLACSAAWLHTLEFQINPVLPCYLSWCSFPQDGF